MGTIQKGEKVIALTKAYKETVLRRIKRDPNFTKALYSKAIGLLIDGEKEIAISIIKDLVHAHISIKDFSQYTQFDEKALHRMLSPKGNPTLKNFLIILKTLGECLGFQPEISVKKVVK